MGWGKGGEEFGGRWGGDGGVRERGGRGGVGIKERLGVEKMEEKKNVREGERAREIIQERGSKYEREK